MLRLIALFFFLPSFSYASKACSFGLQKKELQNYRYVIVPGIFNEFITHYMTEQRRLLMKYGVSKDQIHRINLNSLLKPEETAVVLEKAVEKLPKDKELIFISHSKGALETLYFLKKNHQKIKLKKALLIQGPLDGATITKLPDEKGFLGALNFLVKNLVSLSFVNGYDRSYSSDHVRARLKDIKKEEVLLSKIVFVESSTEYSDLKWKFKPLGGQYQEFFGKAGDGILMDTDHIPFELQQSKTICKLHLKVDHSDLVKAAPWNKEKVLKIRQFMEKVLF